METKDKDQVTFYYNRERRLEKASPNARFMLEYGSSKKRGFLKSLTATRSLRFLFFTTLLAIVAVLGAAWVQRSRAEGTIAGNRVSARAMWFEGGIYLTVRRARKDGQPGQALTVRAGVDSPAAASTLGPGETELKLRFDADPRPGSVSAAIETEHGEAASERLVLIVPVD